MKANFEAQQRVREEDEQRRINTTEETEQEYLQKILYFYYSLMEDRGFANKKLSFSSLSL